MRKSSTNLRSPVALRIERTTEGDLPKLLPLANAIWRTCYRGIITVEQIDYMLAQMYGLATLQREVRSEGIRYDCAMAGDEMVGFASYGPTETDSTYKLHKLYLHPEWHGRGWGSQMLQHCEVEVRKAGARRLILNVNKQNTRAIDFYRRNGFTLERAVIVDIGGGFVMDDYIMSKHLGGI